MQRRRPFQARRVEHQRFYREKSLNRAIIAGFMMTMAGAVMAQEPAPPAPTQSLSKSLGVVVFPAKGQNAQQQSQDEGECYAWAKTDTGVDPMVAAAPPPPPAEQAAQPAGPDGSRVRGAARGAAAGAIIGEIADDDAGKGAAIGAAAGAMRGGAQSRRNQAAAQSQAEQQQQAAQQQAAAQQQQQRELFNKAFSACMQAKSYTVN
jgi:uncharacterized protein YcfJ